ncbi:MAG: hypothetical protein GY822_28535, partial [Deltaproteobacteria bacterium]|nr:hypothetical protein [Deltaproteobacteria bacterium]
MGSVIEFPPSAKTQLTQVMTNLVDEGVGEGNFEEWEAALLQLTQELGAAALRGRLQRLVDK